MELFIIGAGCAIGYWLNKNGKQPRRTDVNVTVDPAKIPSGALIYESYRSDDVDAQVRELAAKKYPERMKQIWPHDYDKPFSVVADVPDDSAQYNFNVSMNSAAVFDSSIHAIDPATGKRVKSGGIVPDFTSNEFEPSKPIDPTAQVSLLSGLPLDMAHGNMQPMFGSAVRQTPAGNQNSQVLLEKYSGVPSSDNQGTYSKRKEVENGAPSGPVQRPNLLNVNQLVDYYERNVIKQSKEYETPKGLQPFRDIPTPIDQSLFMPNVDTRNALNPLTVYEGVVIPGQKGSTRATLPVLNDYQKVYNIGTTEKDVTDWVPNKSRHTASNSIPNVHAKKTDNSGLEFNYKAPRSQPLKIANLGNQANTQREALKPEGKIQNVHLGIASGGSRGMHTGTFVMSDPKKGTRTDIKGQAFLGKGTSSRDVNAPEATLKDTMVNRTTGALNTSGMKNNNAWEGFADMELDPTQKSMDSDNKYIGQPTKNLGIDSQRVALSIQNWITNKETNEFSQTGNAKSDVPAHMSYESVFNRGTDKVKARPLGFAKGNNGSRGDQHFTVEKMELSVDGYIANPTAVVSSSQDRSFEATQFGNSVEFGGHFGASSKSGQESTSRNAKHRQKPQLVVPGRLNGGLGRDSGNSVPSFEVNLVDYEQNVPDEYFGNGRTQPNSLGRIDPIIRVRNGEVSNDRLDIGTKIERVI